MVVVEAVVVVVAAVTPTAAVVATTQRTHEWHLPPKRDRTQRPRVTEDQSIIHTTQSCGWPGAKQRHPGSAMPPPATANTVPWARAAAQQPPRPARAAAPSAPGGGPASVGGGENACSGSRCPLWPPHSLSVAGIARAAGVGPAASGVGSRWTVSGGWIVARTYRQWGEEATARTREGGRREQRWRGHAVNPGPKKRGTAARWMKRRGSADSEAKLNSV